MAYSVEFKNKYTKGKWLKQTFLVATRAEATRVGNNLIKVDKKASTVFRIKKVDGRKDARPVYR